MFYTCSVGTFSEASRYRMPTIHGRRLDLVSSSESTSSSGWVPAGPSQLHREIWGVPGSASKAPGFGLISPVSPAHLHTPGCLCYPRSTPGLVFSPTYRDTNGKTSICLWQGTGKDSKSTVSFPKHLPRDFVFHQNEAQRSEEQRQDFDRQHVLGRFLRSEAEDGADVRPLWHRGQGVTRGAWARAGACNRVSLAARSSRLRSANLPVKSLIQCQCSFPPWWF